MKFIVIWAMSLALASSTYLIAKEVDGTNADAICSALVVESAAEAQRYDWYIQRTPHSPNLQISNLAKLTAKGEFYNPDTGNFEQIEVEASADYKSQLTARADVPTRISFGGGLANLKHTKTGFKLLLGYKRDGEDRWIELDHEIKSEKDFTRYTGTIPAGALAVGRTKVWFEGRYFENGETLRVYESNSGKDYVVDVTKAATKALCFDLHDGVWREAIEGGSLSVGDSVKVVYKHDRMRSILFGTSSASGHPAWNFDGFYRIKGKDGEVLASGMFPGTAHLWNPKTGTPARDRGNFAPSIYIPANAKGGRLEVWFEGHARRGNRWESDYGRNYNVKIDE